MSIGRVYPRNTSIVKVEVSTRSPSDLRAVISKNIAVRNIRVKRASIAKHVNIVDGFCSFMGGLLGDRSNNHPERRAIKSVRGALANDWANVGLDMMVSMDRALSHR